MSYGYVVFGSEDGNIGIFTSKKKAIETALKYCKQSEGITRIEYDHGHIANIVNGRCYATVERFVLNIGL